MLRSMFDHVMNRAPVCATLALMHSDCFNFNAWLYEKVWDSACRYELLVKLNPDNENYKLYYAQSLYKVSALWAL